MLYLNITHTLIYCKGINLSNKGIITIKKNSIGSYSKGKFINKFFYRKVKIINNIIIIKNKAV